MTAIERGKRQEVRQEAVLRRQGFRKAGVVGMDTASILLSDPSYVLHRNKYDPAFGRNWEDYIRKTTEPGHAAKGSKQLRYPMGHAGLGVVLFSGGDGEARVFTKHTGGALKEARILF